MYGIVKIRKQDRKEKRRRVGRKYHYDLKTLRNLYKGNKFYLKLKKVLPFKYNVCMRERERETEIHLLVPNTSVSPQIWPRKVREGSGHHLGLPHNSQTPSA